MRCSSRRGSFPRRRLHAGLKALSNIEPGFSAARSAVVLVDASESSAAAVQWAVQHWWSAGDALHLVHVVCCLLPKLEIYHGAAAVGALEIFGLPTTMSCASERVVLRIARERSTCRDPRL